MRQSEYRHQLREKQKARRFYQVLEKQFRNYYDKASRQPGVTGENLLRLLERRLDNVLVRLGFAGVAPSGAPARHASATSSSTGGGSTCPRTSCKPGDVISVRETSSAVPVIREATEGTATVPAWLQADYDSLTANVLRLPERDEISAPVQEQLIVELYSK